MASKLYKNVEIRPNASFQRSDRWFRPLFADVIGAVYRLASMTGSSAIEESRGGKRGQPYLCAVNVPSQRLLTLEDEKPTRRFSRKERVICH